MRGGKKKSQLHEKKKKKKHNYEIKKNKKKLQMCDVTVVTKNITVAWKLTIKVNFVEKVAVESFTHDVEN